MSSLLTGIQSSNIAIIILEIAFVASVCGIIVGFIIGIDR